MRVVIRTDASVTIGHGHVVRCLTLASALRQRGASVTFVCREHAGHLCDLIEHNAFSVSRLVDFPICAPARAESALSSTEDWQADASQTRDAVEAAGTRPDWLIVDHYGLDHRWVAALRTSVHRVLVVDDLADRIHDCDALLDQNLVARMYTRYLGKVPQNCSLMLGPRYALLHPSYAAYRERVSPRKGPIRRVLVSFGGTDSGALTALALNSLRHLKPGNITIDAALTRTSRHAPEVLASAAAHENIHLHYNLPTLAPLMAQADLAIGAGGTTSWERLCLGLPSLVVTMADNQRAVTAELNRRGLVRWVGHKDQIDESLLSGAASDLFEQGLSETWSEDCLATVDANGADRVAEALSTTSGSRLRARRARPSDSAPLLEWANDPLTRRNGFNPNPISPETHANWFTARLKDPHKCHLYIMELEDGSAIGQVRFEDTGAEGWAVHYSLNPQFRGLRLGRNLLQTAMLEFAAGIGSTTVFGEVRAENYPSRHIFESLGFERQLDSERSMLRYRSVI